MQVKWQGILNLRNGDCFNREFGSECELASGKPAELQTAERVEFSS